VHRVLHVRHSGVAAGVSISEQTAGKLRTMNLEQITDEKDLFDRRTYLCCRSSRHGNALWDTLEARKHQLIYEGISMPLSSFQKVYDLPKRVADTDDANPRPRTS
jgi:hypothetical protein